MDITALKAATAERKAVPQAPMCGATGCTATTGLGQWRRRLTPAEYTQELAILQQRWDDAFALRDTQQPDPVQPPMPPPSDFTRAVIGCTTHAIGAGGATRIHQNTCSGPDSPALPRCDCTPEALPAVKVEHAAVSAAPDHWAAAMAHGGD